MGTPPYGTAATRAVSHCRPEVVRSKNPTQLFPRVYSVAMPVVVATNLRRCFRSVDFMSDGHPKLISINKQPNDQIVHAFRFGETDRPAYQPLDPRAQVDVLALDLLRICLPYAARAQLQVRGFTTIHFFSVKW